MKKSYAILLLYALISQSGFLVAGDPGEYETSGKATQDPAEKTPLQRIQERNAKVIQQSKQEQAQKQNPVTKIITEQGENLNARHNAENFTQKKYNSLKDRSPKQVKEQDLLEHISKNLSPLENAFNILKKLQHLPDTNTPQAQKSITKITTMRDTVQNYIEQTRNTILDNPEKEPTLTAYDENGKQIKLNLPEAEKLLNQAQEQINHLNAQLSIIEYSNLKDDNLKAAITKYVTTNHDVQYADEYALFIKRNFTNPKVIYNNPDTFNLFLMLKHPVDWLKTNTSFNADTFTTQQDLNSAIQNEIDTFTTTLESTINAIKKDPTIKNLRTIDQNDLITQVTLHFDTIKNSWLQSHPQSTTEQSPASDQEQELKPSTDQGNQLPKQDSKLQDDQQPNEPKQANQQTQPSTKTSASLKDWRTKDFLDMPWKQKLTWIKEEFFNFPQDPVVNAMHNISDTLTALKAQSTNQTPELAMTNFKASLSYMKKLYDPIQQTATENYSINKKNYKQQLPDLNAILTTTINKSIKYLNTKYPNQDFQSIANGVFPNLQSQSTNGLKLPNNEGI